MDSESDLVTESQHSANKLNDYCSLVFSSSWVGRGTNPNYSKLVTESLVRTALGFEKLQT